MVVAAAKVGLHRKDVDQTCRRIKENPFSSARKMASFAYDVRSLDHTTSARQLLNVTAASNQLSAIREDGDEEKIFSSESSSFGAHNEAASYVSVVLGAPNFVLDKCVSFVASNGQAQSLTPHDKAAVLKGEQRNRCKWRQSESDRMR